MKPQSTAPQVLQHLLLVQHGTIGSHQHIIARVQPFKSSVVLLLQCAIENVRVDAQYFFCRHAISSLLPSHLFYPPYATEDLPESWSGTPESPSLKKIFTCSRNAFLC